MLAPAPLLASLIAVLLFRHCWLCMHRYEWRLTPLIHFCSARATERECGKTWGARKREKGLCGKSKHMEIENTRQDRRGQMFPFAIVSFFSFRFHLFARNTQEEKEKADGTSTNEKKGFEGEGRERDRNGQPTSRSRDTLVRRCLRWRGIVGNMSGSLLIFFVLPLRRALPSTPPPASTAMMGR